jgi:hypothetical protein
MKEFEVKNLEDLNEFFKTNEKLSFDFKCHRKDDDYTLRIEAYSKDVNNEAMLVFKNLESYTNISIHIDSKKFMDAYNSMGESEKIPPQHEITNPCSHEKYMLTFVEVASKEILPLLGDFNGIKNDYYALAKLAVKKRGAIFGKWNGI